MPDHNIIECPNHEGHFDCNPFCRLCEGEQEYCPTCEGECLSNEEETKMSNDINKEVTIRLTGIKAVEYLIDKYDWNIYGSDYDRLSVIAYRQYRDQHDGGNIRADYSWERIFTVYLRTENDKLISTLVGTNWKNEVWYESDQWDTIDERGENLILNAYLADEGFRNWFDLNIEAYEIEYK